MPHSSLAISGQALGAAANIAKCCAADKVGSDKWKQSQALFQQRREIPGIDSTLSSSWQFSPGS
jgi:hypothetical protein